MKNSSKYDSSDRVAVWLIACITVIGAAFIIAVAIWGNEAIGQSIEVTNTQARCNSAGGEMGHSKCYKDGREI